MAQNPIVTIEMENGDIMKAELYPDVAPNTVNNFISLVNKGYYDGIIFHRVIRGFMLQGGDPTAQVPAVLAIPLPENFLTMVSRMTSSIHRVSFPWHAPWSRIPLAASSLSCTRPAHTWTASTRPLVRSSRAWM